MELQAEEVMAQPEVARPLVQQTVWQEVLQIRDIVEMDSIIRVSPETDSLGMGLSWAAGQPTEG